MTFKEFHVLTMKLCKDIYLIWFISVPSMAAMKHVLIKNPNSTKHIS